MDSESISGSIERNLLRHDGPSLYWWTIRASDREQIFVKLLIADIGFSRASGRRHCTSGSINIGAWAYNIRRMAASCAMFRSATTC